MRSRFKVSGLAMLLVPAMLGTADAHPGHRDVHGFVQGLVHPVSGVDHILAMVMVGVFAAQLGGRAIWLVPASFVAVMLLGGVLGVAGLHVPFLEFGIALSVLVLGSIVAFRLSAAVPAAMALVGCFALFHGFAHGAEIPETVGGLDYGLGFVAATVLLHAAGVGFGLGTGWTKAGRMLVRAAGALAAIVGLALIGASI